MPEADNNRRVTTPQHRTSVQVSKNDQLELLAMEGESTKERRYRRPTIPRPLTSPSLFPDGKTDRMASALGIWGASDILTQKQNLTWDSDSDGKLRIVRPAINNKGEIHYWITDTTDLSDEHPATLAGEAALAVIETFDIRAACMHLIYAGHATKLDRPWEQEFVIDDRQIEEYLGLKKRKHLTKPEKLALIEKLAQQPCQITTFISWPAQGKVKAFTVSETRLWHMLEIQRHYVSDLFCNKELVGLTFRVKAGYWAKYFLNAEWAKDKQAYYQCGTLSKDLLEDVMRIWQHRPGAARLLVWLLFKTKFEQRYPVLCQTLMEVAYGTQRVQEARIVENKKLRQQIADDLELDLLTVGENGWLLHFDSESYPEEIQPCWAGRGSSSRPRGYFERILTGRVWITAPSVLVPLPSSAESSPKSTQRKSTPKPQKQLQPIRSGTHLRELREAKSQSQRQLAALTGISQKMISMIERGDRPISQVNQERLSRALELKV